MAAEEDCSWLKGEQTGYFCGLRGQKLPMQEVTAKCTDTEKAVICVDAYSSLLKGQELIEQQSTEALLWLVEAATQFENLQETDNAIKTVVRGITFATNLNLIGRAYDLFRYARNVYEKSVAKGDPALSDPLIKENLLKAARAMIKTARQLAEGDSIRSMQAELKAAVLSGGGLKQVKRDETQKDIMVLDGRELYAKKATEYREGAEKFISAGIVKNAIVFSCMAALAKLMLGEPKEGIEYLKETSEKSGFKEKFHENPCFNWTKLVFKAFVNRDKQAIEQARKDFFKIPWAFKDDETFARRVMDSVYRRIVGTS